MFKKSIILFITFILFFNFSCRMRRYQSSRLQSLNILDCIYICEDVFKRISQTKQPQEKLKYILFLVQEGRDVAGALILRALLAQQITGEDVSLKELYQSIGNTDRAFLESLRTKDFHIFKGKQIPWSYEQVSQAIVTQYNSYVSQQDISRFVTKIELQSVDEWLNEIKGRNAQDIPESIRNQILGFKDRVSIIFEIISTQIGVNPSYDLQALAQIYALRVGVESLGLLLADNKNVVQSSSSFVVNKIFIPIQSYNLDFESRVLLASYALEYFNIVEVILGVSPDENLNRIKKIPNNLLNQNASVISLLQFNEVRSSFFSALYNQNSSLAQNISQLLPNEIRKSLSSSIEVVAAVANKDQERFRQEIEKIVNIDNSYWKRYLEQSRAILGMDYNKFFQHPRIQRTELIKERLRIPKY